MRLRLNLLLQTLDGLLIVLSWIIVYIQSNAFKFYFSRQGLFYHMRVRFDRMRVCDLLKEFSNSPVNKEQAKEQN